MCKQVLFSNASKLGEPEKFDRFMASILVDQRDGFGSAWFNGKSCFGVRTIDPLDFSSGQPEMDIVDPWVQRFGDATKKVKGPALFHGRISTNVVSLENTHPMALNDWHLVHNGVVDYLGEDYKRNTSNDSEDVVHCLSTGSIDKVAELLEGYYAFGGIDPLGRLHVARDKIAMLYVAWSDKLNSFIYATNTDLIEKIAKKYGEKMKGKLLKPDTYLIYKGNTIVERQSFKSLGYTSYQSKYASQSLGWNLDDSTESTDSIYGRDWYGSTFCAANTEIVKEMKSYDSKVKPLRKV